MIPGDDQAFNGLTLRERLTQHKRNATCATCHLRIDPLGFPLEGFDPVGRTREKYADGKAVDNTGEFADKTTILGADGLLKSVTVATLDGASKKIAADVLLPFFGLSMSLGPIADWNLALERNQIVTDPTTAATSKPGIFAVGDVVHYPGKLKLILTGFAEAAIAARSAYALIHPETPLHFEYSTTAGIPSV